MVKAWTYLSTMSAKMYSLFTDNVPARQLAFISTFVFYAFVQFGSIIEKNLLSCLTHLVMLAVCNSIFQDTKTSPV